MADKKREKATAKVHSRCSLTDLCVVSKFHEGEDTRTRFTHSSLVRVALHHYAELLVQAGLVEPVTDVSEAQAYFNVGEGKSPDLKNAVLELEKRKGAQMLGEGGHSEDRAAAARDILAQTNQS